jgi:hypothetical protein
MNPKNASYLNDLQQLAVKLIKDSTKTTFTFFDEPN